MDKAFPYIALAVVGVLGYMLVKNQRSADAAQTVIIDKRHRTDAGDILGGIGELASGVGAGIGAALQGGPIAAQPVFLRATIGAQHPGGSPLPDSAQAPGWRNGTDDTVDRGSEPLDPGLHDFAQAPHRGLPNEA